MVSEKLWKGTPSTSFRIQWRLFVNATEKIVTVYNGMDAIAAPFPYTRRRSVGLKINFS